MIKESKDESRSNSLSVVSSPQSRGRHIPLSKVKTPSKVGYRIKSPKRLFLSVASASNLACKGQSAELKVKEQLQEL